MNAKILSALLLATLLTGCAALRQDAINSKEKSLVAAGFQARPVSAKQQAAFAALAPYKIQMRVHKGATLYIYPDPKQDVAYVGGPKEYSAYRKMVARQEMIEQQQMSEMEWNYWGPGYNGPGFAGPGFGGVANRVW